MYHKSDFKNNNTKKNNYNNYNDNNIIDIMKCDFLTLKMSQNFNDILELNIRKTLWSSDVIKGQTWIIGNME